MKDTELFSQMLGVVAPWYVKAVRVDTAGLRVEVEVAVKEGTVWGAEDGIRAHVHGYERRRWRHLNTMQCETVVVAKVPRLKWVGKDGKERTEMAAVPWAKKSAGWTV
jgi:hypothetical protein